MFRFYFTIGVLIGLILSLVMVFTGPALQDLGVRIGVPGLDTGHTLQIGSAVVGVIVGTLAYGLALGISGALGALVYNAIAALTGGIVIQVKEE